MTRNLKVLGLALAAVFAFSAVAAQGALAVNVEHTFKLTDVGAADLTGTGEFTLSLGATTFACSSATLIGGVTVLEKDTQALTPEFSGCKLGESAATVTNGEGDKKCTYTFDSDTTADPHTGGESGAVTTTCHEGASIQIVSANGCAVTLSAQGPLQGIVYQNNGEEKEGQKTGIKVEIHIGKTIEYTAAKTIWCKLLGLNGTGHNGTTLGNYTIKAYKTGSDHSIPERQVGYHVITP